MPKKSDKNTNSPENTVVSLPGNKQNNGEVAELTRMLAAVMEYISDDTLEVIDIEYLLDETEGLKDWWEHYQENNRKSIEEEIRNSLSDLSLDDLQKIREQIKKNS
ncbi:hypothetical protein AM500_12815 [Bacillus sp. FJAT-18017]|uniref:hypothetical protein n=1 Tax=Bacillus sp. FJAT-18017 TaxID=1705566 RepID=UPI0006AF01D7|nr:hypothetical protein [Bacillus sp. FJAT-18017]ALC90569.1 hypothetical protein AM500_12815 [Bacillus sp. FJAT-18017]